MSEKKILGKITMPNGKQKNVLDENGRFWICKDAWFRKSRFELIPVPVKENEKEKPKKESAKKEEKYDAV